MMDNIAPLPQFSTGHKLQLHSMKKMAGNVGLRLRELGFLEGVEIEILKNSDPMVVRFGETRLGIELFLASQMFGRLIG